ncbi:alpha/beta hydrolase [Streptomyces cinnamoneus]|uniref:alpha/beta fold hydrolase n=1 Tax=Streptomyces cinnamoneus TaxID=53446 RepID=UPI0033EF9828
MRRVLLLHGLANNGSIWSGLAGHWRDDLHVHAPDLPWHSGNIAGWRHETDSARLVGEAIDDVPGGPDLIVAHSFSSVLLLELLSRRAAAGDPLDVPGVVLVNPFYRAAADDFHWDMIAPTLQSFPDTLGEALRLRSLDRPIDPELREDMARRLCEWIGPYGWLRFFDTYLRTPLFPVALVHTPALVIGGGLDTSAPADDARTLAGLMPAAEALILPDSGHFPMLERPGPFAETVHAFLDRTLEPTGSTAAI